MIDGRGGCPDPDGVQNWESGVELTVQGSLFYRNFAAGLIGALALCNAWPFRGSFDNTDFVHNEAFFTPQDSYHWNPGVRSHILRPLANTGLRKSHALPRSWDQNSTLVQRC